MSSSMLRLRSLGRLTANFSKFEITPSFGNFQRAVTTDCVLFSNVTRQFMIHDMRDAVQPGKNSDFGKVVDLDYTFDELKVDEVTKPTVNSDRRTRHEKPLKMRRAERRAQAKEAKESIADEDGETGNEEESEPYKEEFEQDSRDAEKQNFKLSKDDSYVFRKIMTELKSRKTREKERKIILEGKRLIQDALSAGHKPLKIFFSRFSDIRTLNLPEDVAVTQVPYKTLNLWSDVVTSQGVIGVFKMPEIHTPIQVDCITPLTIICDNIRDPGNLGTILRIASAAGCQGLILTTGCADIWDPKVLRAGAGAHFRLPVQSNAEWSDIEDKIPEGTQIVLADNKIPVDSGEVSEGETDEKISQLSSSAFKNSSELANSLPVHCFTSFQYDTDGAVIVLGGETHGLSDEAYQFTVKRNGSRVYLPMFNGTESLNSAVALGVLSYEFRRQISKIVDMKSSKIINNESQIETSE